MKKQAWLILSLITVVAGLALSLTNLVTAGPIAEQKLLASNAARAAVFHDADGFEAMPVEEGSKVDSVYAATKGGQTVGHVLQTTVTGYGGPIEIVMGIDTQGAITGLSVGGSSFAETAGLGTRTRDPEFTDQFVGLKAAPKLKQNIDAISGATISSTAVANGANRLYQYWQRLTGAAQATEAPQETVAPASVKTVTVAGYGGDFDVTVSLDADGAVQDVQIGGAGFNETEGFGAQALEADFRNQFRGKRGPLAYGDGIDAIAGATITSNAVLKAINEALGGTPAADTQQDEAADTGETGDGAAGTAATAAPAAGDGLVLLDAPDANGAVMIYTETVRGFADEIVVKVGLDDDDAIVSLVIGGPRFAETEYLGAQVQTNQFRNQFLGKSGQLAYGTDVDAVAGATVTSDAVLGAINNALRHGKTETDAALNTVSVQRLDTPDANGAVTICTDTVKGFANEIVVTVGLDAANTVVSLTVGGPHFSETEYYGAQAQTNAFRSQFIGKTGPFVYGEGVDAIAGATVTSNAVLQAVNDCLAQALQP